MKRNNILDNCPLEVLENLSKVLSEVCEYNNISKYTELYNCDKEGATDLLHLQIIADSMVLIKARETYCNK